MRPLKYSLLFFCLACGSVPAQKLKPKNPPAAPAAPAGMTNDDVLALASAGMPDDVITAKIHAAPSTSFDTSVTGLKALKAGGVSGPVIRYMIDPSAAPAPAVAAAAAPAVAAAPSPDDPLSSHSPGVYILAQGADGQIHLTKLDHIQPKNTKTNGMFLSSMTYGIAKAHTKASVDGAHATVQTTDTDPTFYAYIPEDNNSFGGASITVRDLTLMKFDVKETNREVNTAAFSVWGSSTGTDQKDKQGFAAEQIKPGVYKMTLIRPLPAGQYAFQHQNYGAFFDFGITPAK